MAERRVKMKGVRRAIAQNLKRTYSEYPHTYSAAKYHFGPLQELREQMKSEGKKVSYSALFVKAIAVALQKNPDLNARQEGEEIVYYDTCNAGIGVDRGKGLYVVVIRDVQEKGVLQITREMDELVEKLGNGTIAMADLKGSTFTVSNLSMTVAETFCSLLNNDECFIMGFGRTKKEPVVLEDDTIAVRSMANIMLNINHAIIDGYPAQIFLADVIDALEHPEMLLTAEDKQGM